MAGLSEWKLNFHDMQKREFSPEEHEIVQQVDNCYYPLRIIIAVEGQTITVITNYPLKKGIPK
ncbi:hypothetical protein THII_0530 [Thioploca ingrica]|uniref:DUF4258 domain-containing protein n=1 Tax=Thioploca ingrica TaxID=40754 RepID=A0A090AHN7_9GAMM|nr:hypothetical protein THII_0530 [Thioploca ingrica]